MSKVGQKLTIISLLTISLASFTNYYTGDQTSPNQVVYAQEDKKRDKSSVSILLMGIDTGEFGREDRGRSDVMMVALLNKENKDIALISIPRDTYTEIVGYNSQDKINHAYAFGGPKMAVDSVENLLDMEIDHYLAVDMAGLQKIVDVVDGVEITPSVSFSIDGYDFQEGVSTHVDGPMALAYVRERYTSGGDYARQERQRQLIQAVVNKAFSQFDIKSAKDIADALKDDLETDINFFNLIGLTSKVSNLDGSINVYQLQGEGVMMDGVYYDIPLESSLEEVKDLIQERIYE